MRFERAVGAPGGARAAVAVPNWKPDFGAARGGGTPGSAPDWRGASWLPAGAGKRA